MEVAGQTRESVLHPLKTETTASSRRRSRRKELEGTRWLFKQFDRKALTDTQAHLGCEQMVGLL